MDKERLKEEAKEFIGEGSSFVHCEMKNGKNPQIVIAGDFLGILWICTGIIRRVAELTGTTYEQTAEMVGAMPFLGGYGTLRNELKKDGGKYRFIEGEDWQEKWKEQKEKEIKAEAHSDNISLAFNLAQMEKRNTSLNNQLVDLKKDYHKKLKAKDEEIKALNKEILALEHRIKEMAEQRMWGDEA